MAVPKPLEEYCRKHFGVLDDQRLEKNGLRDHGSDVDKSFHGDPLPTAKNSSLIWFPDLWQSMYASNNSNNSNSNSNSNDNSTAQNNNNNNNNNTRPIEWIYSVEGVQIHPVTERFTPF